MVNRKSLVFALCATSSIIGLAGCSDDSGSSSEKPSGNESLVVNPTSVQLSKGQELPVTVLHSAASITATSNDESCVTSTVVNESSGVSKVNIKTASTQSCATTVEIKGDSEVKSVAAAVVFGKPILNVNPQKIDAKIGGKKRATAEYTKDGDALADKTLTLSLTSTDCVTLASDEVTTNDQGKAHIDITAGDKACETTLTITPPDKDVTAQTVEIKVTEDGTVVDDGKGVLEFFDPKSTEKEISFTLNGGTTSKNFSVRYFNSESKDVIASAKVIFTTEGDEKCIELTKSKTEFTNDAGIASNGVTFITDGDDGCDASVIIATGNTDVDTLKVKVHVDAIEDYRMKVVMNVDKSSTAAKIGYAQAAFMQGIACEELEDHTQWIGKIGELVDNFGELDKDSINTSGLPLGEVIFNAVPVLIKGGKGSVIAYATNSKESNDIIAYGCYDMKERRDGEVTVKLSAVPLDLKGEYDVVSNFDLLSGFKTTDNFNTSNKSPVAYGMPVAEKMLAGDWIVWISALFNDPIYALYNFIWVNTIERLKGIDPGSDPDNKWVQSVLGVGFSVGYNALKPWLEDFLKSEDGANYSWYEILKMVGPDVSDLAQNMQLIGTMTYPSHSKEKVADKYLYSNAQVDYSYLHYQWSYIAKGANTIQGCDDTAYAKPFDKNTNRHCRRKLPLSDNSLTGTYSGSVQEPTTSLVDGLLTIDPHSLNFKWASILFAAVFGTNGILHSSIPGYTMEQNDVTKKDLYIGSLLSNLVFKPIVNSYEKKLQGKEFDTTNNCYKVPNEKGEIVCRKPLKQPATDPCLQFLEAIIYIIKPDNPQSWVDKGLLLGGPIVCERVLTRLDELVIEQLDKFQSGSESIFTLKSKGDCNMYSNGMSSYQMLGKGDEQFHSAKLIANGAKTNRCEWDLKLTHQVDKKDDKGNVIKDEKGNPIKQSETIANIKGFFHATRKN